MERWPLFPGGRQEGFRLAAEPVEVQSYTRYVGFSNCAKIADAGRPAHFFAMLIYPSKTLKDFLCGFLIVCGKSTEYLIGMLVQSIGQTTYFIVMRDVERSAVIGILPMGPGPHECMLQARKFIGIVSGVIQDLLDQPECDAGARHNNGTFD